MLDTPSSRDLLREETLRQVVEDISSELELRPLLTKIVRSACELLRADRGTIGLVDKERNLIRTEAAHNMPEGELGAEMPAGVGLAGQVLSSQQALLLDDYGKVDTPVQTELAQDAVIGMPIVWRGEMVGFFGIGAAPPRRFEQADVDTLELFSRHAAVAIHNAQLFESEKRRAARMEAISKIAQLMTSSLSLSDILQTSVEAINDALAFSSTGIFLVSATAPDTLVLQARKGPGDFAKVGHYTQTFGEGNVGLAAQTCRTVHVVDAKIDPNYVAFPGADRLKSELALPIVVADKLLGVLNVESEDTISEEDAGGLEIVVDQLGVAIDNARLFAETEVALNDMHLLYESSQRISMAMDVDGVVEAYLKQVATQRRYRCSVAYFELEEGKRKRIALLGRWVPGQGVTTERFSVPYFEDAFDALLDAGKTVTMKDVADDRRASETLKAAQLKGGYPALALIPLISRGQRIGVISLSLPHPHTWSATDLRPYQVTAAQLATAISSRLQQEKLLAGEQQLAVLEERQRLARELHDSVTQVIFSMTLVAQTVGSVMQRDPAEGEKRVDKLLGLAQKARAEMRALLAELRPASDGASIKLLPDPLRVREYGLVKALESLLEEQSEDALRIGLFSEGYKRRTLKVEQALYRIVQEALANVTKHAVAETVHVELRVDDLESHLRIEDDGRGFAVTNIEEGAGHHVGLNSMRERAEALGGDFTLHSRVGEGTRISVQAFIISPSLTAQRQGEAERCSV